MSNSKKKKIQPLDISPSRKTPAVHFDPEKGELSISGRSLNEHPLAFFEPVFEWLDRYVARPTVNSTTLRVSIEYFNTSSAICLYRILNKLKALDNDDSQLTIKWEYHPEDEEMFELGEDFSRALRKNFEFIATEED